jgi:hypothetical protein
VPSNLPKQIEASVAKFAQTVQDCRAKWMAVRDAVGLREMELEIHGHARALADEITEHLVRHIVGDAALQAQASLAARSENPSKYRHGGRRSRPVTLLGGRQIVLAGEYLKPNRRASSRSGRGRRRRGQSGTGMYPVLAALGIWFGVTPALAGEVCRQIADSDSVRTGRAALARRGIVLGHERTLRVVNQTSRRVAEQRQHWLASARAAPARVGPLAHKRVVVATDGGRIRERVPARHGRRRAQTGHRRYDTPWREPKQLVIYVINSRTGAVEESFRPVYDATLADCNAIFDMLTGYLKALGAHEASRLVEVVDWYHAVEKLHEIADVPARWSKPLHDHWVNRAKAALHKGDTAAVANMIDELAVGRRAKDVAKHRDYFVRNHHRMQYVAFKKQHLPLGSGAVESAVRRVINQRMKACGTFWLEANADGMLVLRSYLKCGRFDDLIDWSLLSATPWWPPTTPRDLSAGPLLHVDA